jgi:uncharacterized membrane protein (UPF0182 family)
VLPRRVANLEIGEEVSGRYLVAAAALVSAGLGTLLTIPRERWTTLALAHFGRAFGESDPYLERDLGFFVYWLPLERALYVWALVALLVVTALVVLLYALTPSLSWENGTLRVSNYVRRHLVVLAAILLLLLAWSYRLDTYTALLDGRGPDGAFGYAEHRAAIPVNVGLSILALVSAALVWWSGWTGQLRIAFAVIGIVLLLSVTLRHVSPALAGRFARVKETDEFDSRGWKKVHVGFDVEEMACEYAVSFGPNLEVIEPLSLREKVIEMTKTTLEFYANRAQA